MLEAKTMDRQIRLRGIEEEKDENTYQKMVTILSEFLEKPEEEIQDSLDLAYRVNSAFAISKKLPRDIVIQLTTMRKKDEILKRHYETPMEIDNKKIMVLKEIPKKVLMRRKKYREMTDYLKDNNIFYRWEMPEGLSFQFKGKRKVIKSAEQMTDFLERLKMADDKLKMRPKLRNGK